MELCVLGSRLRARGCFRVCGVSWFRVGHRRHRSPAPCVFECVIWAIFGFVFCWGLLYTSPPEVGMRLKGACLRRLRCATSYLVVTLANSKEHTFWYNCITEQNVTRASPVSEMRGLIRQILVLFFRIDFGYGNLVLT